LRILDTYEAGQAEPILRRIVSSNLTSWTSDDAPGAAARTFLNGLRTTLRLLTLKGHVDLFERGVVHHVQSLLQQPAGQERPALCMALELLHEFRDSSDEAASSSLRLVERGVVLSVLARGFEQDPEFAALCMFVQLSLVPSAQISPDSEWAAQGLER